MNEGQGLATGNPHTRRSRVFVVEDEALIALELQDHLSSLGYEVCGHAARGLAAVREIPAASPDLVVLDINLGGDMNGIEVAERLRGICDVAIVFLTAYSDRELTERAAKTEAHAYLLKPYQPEALKANLELALFKHRAQRQLHETNLRLDLAKITLEERALALSRSHALLHAAFEATTAGLAVVEGGAVKAANRGLFELWRTPEDLTEAGDPRLPAWIRAHFGQRERVDPLGSARAPSELGLRDGRVVERAVWPLAGEGVAPGHLISFRDVTRQRRAAAALRESEELHRALFENAPVGLAIAELGGAVLLANTRLLEIVGLARSELATLRSALVGDEGAELLARARGREVVDRVQIRGLRRDGEEVTLRVTLRPVTVEERPAILAMIEDFTEESRRKEGLRALSGELARVGGEVFFAEATRLLARLLGVDAALIAERAPDTGRLRSLGLTVDGALAGPSELAGDLAALGLADVDAWVVEDGAASRLASSPLLAELGMRGASALTLHDAEGGVIGVIAVMSRHRLRRPEWTVAMLRLFAGRAGAEIERQRELARFRNLFEYAPDAKLLVREDGRIILANRRAVDLFGYTEDELLALMVEALVPETVRGHHHALRESFYAGLKPRGMGAICRPLTALSKSGETIPVDISLGPLRAGDDPEVIVVIRDLRERLAAEAKRRALEDQLRESQKMEALGALAGGVAHDFNNLLSVMVANIERMRREPGLTDGVDEGLDAVSVAANRATELVRRILSFSRRQPAHRVALSVHALVREVVGLLRPVLPAWIRIDVEAAGDIAPVLADPIHIHQVLLNLVTNASHAIGESPGVITIRTESGVSAETGGRVTRIVVLDSGRGIAPELLPRIFEPFFTTKPIGEGSGLGLSVVQGIVHEHGGTIKVESEPGLGARFSVELPAAEDERPPEATRTEPICGQGHVLFIDDEPLLVHVGEALLARLGYTVTARTLARDALDLVRADPGRFVAVITDFEMPELSGVEVVRELARIAPTLPVILASGRRMREGDDLAAAGIQFQITKPYGVHELGEVLARACARVDADEPS